ncbi:EF-hand domain and Zinc finger, C2H2 domain and EF-hand domain pair and Zinc finger, C2H2-like domain-containing protein [Strongyloides ratti]|uniref:EF-hand domain and Zinc finger, C2H2 domain and EF-hand domain pair and Zinc finger, C2H2-like domain-containing protein n=1 Tax=Strongyloides ratti TaxID=34506 RepID=A0A090LCH9_STRRB|nr:EF-hand domain and Zinc finger, C2H2 domain and EF-hand domain pair and Zinc finger, C2H2-like domain-containing protein [Strongyloides ratti]CEF65823.1 EF-hand domain and Zinc finger, C2H2 domain and EF-hand domain pair and Zinc finger, C2H2-like domain-containing protein [Strongyloides ratti]
MSYCEINTAQQNQQASMDESVDSGIVRRSLRSNVRCNYKDMINGTKKNSNASDRSRSLSAGKKLKIKPVLSKKDQISGGVSCSINHNNSSDGSGTFRTTKSASHTTTTDDETTTNSNQSLSVSPDNNLHSLVEVSIPTTNIIPTSKRSRRPPSAHKDYLNEKQVKEIQRNGSKNSSKSLTPDPNIIVNTTKSLSCDNDCGKVDGNVVKNNHTQKYEIANELLKKIDSSNTLISSSSILEIEINKDASVDEPRCSLSPPLKMSITRGKGSVSPKITSFTVNVEDSCLTDDKIPLKSDTDNENNETVKSDVIPTIIFEENDVMPTIEEIRNPNTYCNENDTTDSFVFDKDYSKKISKNTSSDVTDLKCDENPASFQAEKIPAKPKLDVVKNQCPILPCMDESTNPPKLEVETNEERPKLEPAPSNFPSNFTGTTNTNQNNDTSGPPLLEPVPEGPKEDSFEDLDLKCHEDLELMDLDVPKNVQKQEEEVESMDTTTPSPTIKNGKRKSYTLRKGTPSNKNETKTPTKRSYNKNPEKYKCKECGFTTGRIADFKLHNKTHENSDTTKTGKRRKRSYSFLKQEMTTNDTPKEEVENAGEEKNIKLEKLYTIEDSNIQPSNESSPSSPEKIYKCKECPFTNTLISRIESHVTGHTKRTGFKCPVCTYFCGSAGFMKKHTILHGEDCPWPPQFFGSKKGGNARYQTPPPVLIKNDEIVVKEDKKEQYLKSGQSSQHDLLQDQQNEQSNNQRGGNRKKGGIPVILVTDDMKTKWKSMNIQKKLSKERCHIKLCSFEGTSISSYLHKKLYHYNKIKKRLNATKTSTGSVKEFTKNKKNNKKSGKNIKKIKGKVICKDCKKNFTNKKKLNFHRIISYLTCNKVDKINFKKMVVETTDIVKEYDGIFYCLECPFWASDFSITESHAKGHLEKFSHCCDKCQWSADEEKEIKIHEQWHSTEITINDENDELMNSIILWNCEDCPYKTHDVYEMRSHTRLHQGQRNQRCSQCTFSCDGASTLTQHLQVHGKITKRGKPKRQTIKREPITDKIVSREVMKKTENGLSVRALKLVIKSATLKETYEMHKCETCPYYATSEDSIFKHVALHILPKGGKTMQECLDCEFYCESSDILKEHVRVHDNAFIIPYFIQTLFSCKMCDFTSSEESVLKNHEQKCTKEVTSSTLNNSGTTRKPYRGRKRKAPEDEDISQTDTSTREVSTDDVDNMTLDDWLKEYNKKFGLPRTVIETKTKTVVKERPRHNVLNLYSSRVNSANDGNYNCKACPFTTRFQAVMRAHETHHRYTQQHNCSICSYSVNDVRNLMNHLKWHEVNDELSSVDKKGGLKKNGPYKALTSRVGGSGSHQYECPFNPCTFKSPFAHSFNAHVSEHAKKHKSRIFTALKRKNGDNLKNEKTFKPPKESKNLLMCGECQFSTHFSDEMSDHQEAHKDIYLEHQCTVCTFGSDSLVYLNIHLTDHHTDEVKKSADLTNLNERQLSCLKFLKTMAEDIEEILSEIDGSQIEEYQKFFDMFDRGKQGYIMATQIGQIMHAMEQDFDEKQLRKLIRKFDADGSGKLEFDEFCALVYTVANTVDKETLQKELREAFRLFDKEGNGYISRPTLKALLKEIADDLTDQQLDEAVDEIDEDGSGKIEFEEFWELMAGEAD